MSSHQDPYYYYMDPNRIYDESDAEPPVSQPSSSSVPSWPPTATPNQQGIYCQPDQSFDPVGSQLDIHDPEVRSCHNLNDAENYPPSDLQDMDYGQNHSSYPPPNTSSQDHVAGTYATQDNVNTAYYYDPRFYYESPQQQYGSTPYQQLYDYSQPAFVYDAHQTSGGFAIHTPQASQGPSASAYPYPSSTQIPSLGSGRAVYEMSVMPTRRASGSSTLDGAVAPTMSTELPTTDARQHSHPPPVAETPSNQSPSHSFPNSPERKRLLPLLAEEEPSEARRVIARYDGAESAASSSRTRSRSNSVVPGRGPLIPQERYTTSSISTAENHPSIPFNLENPGQMGIPITDILKKSDTFARIQDGAQAFSHMGKKTFTLRVQWPGYRPWAKTIAALDWTKSRAPITRVKLAEAVATAVRDLFQKYRNQSYDSDYAEWHIGPHGIQLDQVCLVALHHVSRGSWQPRLCLLAPRR